MTSSQKTTTRLLAAALLALGFTACRPAAPDPRGEAPAGDAPPSPGSASATDPLAEPAPLLTANPDAPEIFRRAFWRHPNAQDRILHAERRETRSAAAGVERWQWFLAIRPSPALLTALRDLETFQLTRVATPRLWPDEPTPPAWFPATDALAGFEILQAPDAGLTVLYRASDDTLFATDSGQGFAAPVSRTK